MASVSSLRCLSIPENMKTAGASYMIRWKLQQGCARASELHGQHEYLRESKRFAFEEGQGVVGSMILQRQSVQKAVLLDVQDADQFTFLRKQEALTSGIRAIIFLPSLPAQDATLEEIGFSSVKDAREFLESMSADAKAEEPGGMRLPLARRRNSSFLRASSEPRTPCASFSSVETASTSASSSDNGQSDVSSSDNETDSEETACAPSAEAAADVLTAFCRERSPEPFPTAVCRERSPEPFRDPAQVQLPPSVGSLGHPHFCSFPCKYAFKGKGCKEGANCLRCHLCRWSRQTELFWKQSQALEKGLSKSK